MFGSCDCDSMVLVYCVMVWFARSQSMCCGVFLGTVRGMMPIVSSVCFIVVLNSSVPLSNRISLMVCGGCV